MHEPVETARLLIRPFVSSDWESFGRNVLTDPRLAVFFAGEDDPRAYVNARCAYDERPRFYDFAVTEKETGEVIGEFNAAYIRSLDAADMGLVISMPYQRRGLGKETLTAMMQYLGNEGVTSFYGACQKNNPASMALMKSAGMQECDPVPEQVRKRESEADLCFFFCRK
jgi:RimJ/RimL family protein N-acetyltransferase